MDYRRSPTQSPYGTPRELHNVAPPPPGNNNSNAGGPSNNSGGSSNSHHAPNHDHYYPQPHHSSRERYSQNSSGPKFDILLWYPQYQNCLQYFVEVSQHTYACQALAAFINIRLPYQRDSNNSSHSGGAGGSGGSGSGSGVPIPSSPHFRPGFPSSSSTGNSGGAGGGSAVPPGLTQYGWVSLHPYIRRLVATGFDVPAILHGWFGDNWASGVGPLYEQERRNYLFAAKSGGWSVVKRDYDDVSDEAIPYLMPLGRVEDGEIEGAEGMWSKWLAMEDWMLGARAPINEDGDGMSN